MALLFGINPWNSIQASVDTLTSDLATLSTTVSGHTTSITTANNSITALQTSMALKRGYINFWLSNAANSLTDSKTLIVDNTNSAANYFVAPHNMQITGISIVLVGGGASGSYTATPFVGTLGSEADPGASYDVTVNNSASPVAASTAYNTPIAVSAGQSIAVALTTSGLSATTGDVHVYVEVG